MCTNRVNRKPLRTSRKLYVENEGFCLFFEYEKQTDLAARIYFVLRNKVSYTFPTFSVGKMPRLLN